MGGIRGSLRIPTLTDSHLESHLSPKTGRVVSETQLELGQTYGIKGSLLALAGHFRD